MSSITKKIKTILIIFLMFNLILSRVLSENICSDLDKKTDKKLNVFFSVPYKELIASLEISYNLSNFDSQYLNSKFKPIVFNIKPEEKVISKEVLITEKGFEPKEIKIRVNNSIIWKNQRQTTKSLVYGVREISEMKSKIVSHNENFTWQFSQPGIYTYIDAIVLGRVGKIIVQ